MTNENLMHKRLNIGLLTSDPQSDYVTELCLGINHAAAELDHNVVIFPGMLSNNYSYVYEYQHNLVYRMAPECDIDVYIIPFGSMSKYIYGYYKDPKDFLDYFKNKPILLLENSYENYPSIKIDNRSGMKQCMEFLINDCGYKKIAFVSGNADNPDAREREEVYFECMKNHGLETKPSLFARGEFTAACESQVGGIIDNNPGLEAIAFANDEMALGGYREMARRGLVAGKDIAVTGFDDSAIAQTLDPPLTSVKVSTYNLGYNAVYEAVRIYQGKNVAVATINSEFVVRASSGEVGANVESSFANILNNEKDPVNVAALLIAQNTLVRSGNIDKGLELIDAVRPLVEYIYQKYVVVNGHGCFNRVREFVRTILGSRFSEYISVDNFQMSINDFINECAAVAPNRDGLIQLLNNLNLYVTHYYYCTMHDRIETIKKQTWVTTHITRDALIYDTYDNKVFGRLLEKVKLLGINFAGVYLYEKPVTNYGYVDTMIPDRVYLKCSLIDGVINVNENGGIPIGFGNICHHAYLAQRHTFMVFSLFMNETHHGIFVCEVPITNYDDAYYASVEIGSALKYLDVMRHKNEIQEMLHDNNILLERQSNSDDLTALLNRRGFFHEMQGAVNSNPGKTGILLYCDLDNLKKINDMFGHNEGDYAIKSAAMILCSCIRGSDIIGRIGGDEFTILVLAETQAQAQYGEGNAEIIRDRVSRKCAEFNNQSDKQYNVTISVGSNSFICSADCSINDIITDADIDLYRAKKIKNRNYLKG